jgi:hypothetical protein
VKSKKREANFCSGFCWGGVPVIRPGVRVNELIGLLKRSEARGGY